MIDEHRMGTVVAGLSITSKVRMVVAMPLMLVAPSIGRRVMPNVLLEEVEA